MTDFYDDENAGVWHGRRICHLIPSGVRQPGGNDGGRSNPGRQRDKMQMDFGAFEKMNAGIEGRADLAEALAHPGDFLRRYGDNAALF